MKDFGWLIGLILLFVFLKVFLGGFDASSIFGVTSSSPGTSSISRPTEETAPSSSSLNIDFQRANARTENRREEYVRIIAKRKNTGGINITGWKLRSEITGKTSRIGEGAELYLANRVNKTEPIILEPGDTAIVATAGPPLGVSFRVNKCSGYLEQYQDFAPSLRLNCPRLRDEDLNALGIRRFLFDSDDEYVAYDECLDFIDDRVRSCEVSFGNSGLEDLCNNVIRKHANYAGCVELHKNDEDFFEDEWRVFLGVGGGDALWRKERETVSLIDTSGKAVGSFSY